MSRITLENIYVEFPVYNAKSTSFRNQLIRLSTGGRLMNDAGHHIIVRALDDLSITFTDGDRVGLLGHNGAGKSTFLRLLAGIYEPVRGNLKIEGKVSPLLSLLEGLDSESTGYDNIRIRGIISGLSADEIIKKTAEIAEFSELGDYLAMPIRTYSSGMLVRLAFAIVTTIDPEIMIIDEVFGAGDATFMEKAERRMIDLMDRSNIVVFASHDNELVRRFCNKALRLDAGKIVDFGDVNEILDKYEQGN